MRVPLRVLKLVVMVPALLVSGVLGLMVLAVLPPVLGLLGFLAGGGALGVLAAGGLEGPAVRPLTRARAATEGERAVLRSWPPSAAWGCLRSGCTCAEPRELRLRRRSWSGSHRWW